MTDEMEARRIRITVTPEPTDEELAAIAGVMTALAASSRQEPQRIDRHDDRWRKAGRHEALREATWPPENVGQQ